MTHFQKELLSYKDATFLLSGHCQCACFNHVTNRRLDVPHRQKKEGCDRHEIEAITTSEVKPCSCLQAHTFILQKEKNKTASFRVYSNHHQCLCS